MIPRSENFRGWFGTWFSDISQEVDTYLTGCETARRWLADDAAGFAEFRHELAAHIRDSSYPPPRGESQWSTDEWLRDIWYDVFGPDSPAGDPYPVSAGHWGRVRLTSYMLHAVDDRDSSPGTAEWLARRGLTASGIYAAFSTPVTQMLNVRPQPGDFADRLRRLTVAGLRQPGEAA